MFDCEGRRDSSFSLGSISFALTDAFRQMRTLFSLAQGSVGWGGGGVVLTVFRGSDKSGRCLFLGLYVLAAPREDTRFEQ